jgi:hypothetical protein
MTSSAFVGVEKAEFVVRSHGLAGSEPLPFTSGIGRSIRKNWGLVASEEPLFPGFASDLGSC